MKFVKLKLNDGRWDARYTRELEGYVSEKTTIPITILTTGLTHLIRPSIHSRYRNLSFYRQYIC
jgi:hypothetical protein